MSNLYVTIDEFMGLSENQLLPDDQQRRARSLLERASRQVDEYVRRYFYDYKDTRYFDGDGSICLLLPYDLIEITTLKTDDNDDRTFETTWSSSDYFLLPHNADPTTRLNPTSRPYWQIETDLQGDRTGFPRGRRLVEIAGSWGYWRHLKRATETLGEALDATETAVDLDSRTDIQAGHTILVDSEQMFVQSYEVDTLTVVRGVNGTTTASHSSGAAIDIYEYPGPVVEATLEHAYRMWKRKDSGFARFQGLPDGSTGNMAGMDLDVRQMLDDYRLRGL